MSETQDKTARLLTTRDVARELQLSTGTVRRLIDDGHLPAIDLGHGRTKHRILRVEPEALKEFKHKRRVRPLPPQRRRRRKHGPKPMLI